ncbi:hypothetical protein J4225_03060 [Candidatus Pacearchaeota archaeon]|nr:hypothetical protein [uncultured archaeon]MBS3085640.1 hypothetical protein [Candidatus Pacearchaeota archaeon]
MENAEFEPDKTLYIIDSFRPCKGRLWKLIGLHKRTHREILGFNQMSERIQTITLGFVQNINRWNRFKKTEEEYRHYQKKICEDLEELSYEVFKYPLVRQLIFWDQESSRLYGRLEIRNENREISRFVKMPWDLTREEIIAQMKEEIEKEGAKNNLIPSGSQFC